MTSSTAVKLAAGRTSTFPTPADGDPVIQVVINPGDVDGFSFDVHTNMGAGMAPDQVAHAVGFALHQAAHALLGGQVIDLTDLVALPEVHR